MATTAIFAEIVVVGTWTLTWMLLGLGIFHDPALFKLDLAKFDVLLATVILSYAYSLGVVMDRLADFVWTQVRRGGGQPDDEVDTGRTVGEMRSEVRARSEGLTEFLDYVRSRLRIARALVVNLPLVAATALAWGLSTSHVSQRNLLLSVFVVAAVSTVGAIFAAWRLDATYEKRLRTAYRVLPTMPAKSPEHR